MITPPEYYVEHIDGAGYVYKVPPQETLRYKIVAVDRDVKEKKEVEVEIVAGKDEDGSWFVYDPANPVRMPCCVLFPAGVTPEQEYAMIHALAQAWRAA